MSIYHGADQTPARNDNSTGSPGRPRPGLWRSRAGLVAIGFLAIAAYLLASEHRVHALGYLPLLLLLACPLMHLFMHRGHGGHGGPDRSGAGSEADASDPARERGHG